MTNWFDSLIGRKPKSAGMAKERLKMVLINDRTDLTPGALDKLKDELLKVISRYVDIDPETVSIEMTQVGREQRLVAEIPVRTVARRHRSG